MHVPQTPPINLLTTHKGDHMLIEVVGGCFIGLFFIALWKALFDKKEDRREPNGIRDDQTSPR